MRLLVLGAGVSGKAAARLARRLGYEAAIYDRRPGPTADLRDEGFEVHSGDFSGRLLRRRDLVVASPGLPDTSQPVTDTLASGIPLVGELEFAYRVFRGTTIAVTGTNGKTTVTAVAAEMLQASGIRGLAVGNIGHAFSDVADRLGPDAVAVVEASSFQLRFVDTFHPKVAVVLNVAPDHLDWHGSFEAYAAAKRNILTNVGRDDLVVYDAGDPGANALVAGTTARLAPVRGAARLAGESGPEGGKLWLGDIPIDLDGNASLDRSFLVDLAAAGLAAQELGADPDAIGAVVRTFRPGPHRRTVVGERGGVVFVDDSKATNPHAALASIAAFDSVVLIAGGLAKGLDLAPLVEADNVSHVVAIGTAAADLVAIGGDRVSRAGDMQRAVEIAVSHARPGTTVLLAPGCASFDMFASYAARGEAFAAAVAGLETA